MRERERERRDQKSTLEKQNVDPLMLNSVYFSVASQLAHSNCPLLVVRQTKGPDKSTQRNSTKRSLFFSQHNEKTLFGE